MDLEIYKLQLRKISLGEVEVLVIIGTSFLLVYIFKLVMEALIIMSCDQRR